MTVWIFQHMKIEPPGLIRKVLEMEGIHPHIFHTADDGVPHLTHHCSALVVMGGNMGVYEQEHYPWIQAETAAIRQALEWDVPILGICLGAQLVASAGGSKVYKGDKQGEVGWCPIRLTEAGLADPLTGPLAGPERQPDAMAFQWHGDTFDLPAGATRLAGSAKYENQAFRMGSAWAIQFHPEVDRKIIHRWITSSPDYALAAGTSPEEVERGIPFYLDEMSRRGEQMFHAFAAKALQRMAQRGEPPG